MAMRNLYAPISASAAGSSEVVAPVAGKRIVPTRYFLTASAPVNVKFQSNAVDLSGSLALAVAGNGLTDEVYDCLADGLFATGVGEALNINLSAAATVGGYLAYRYEG